METENECREKLNELFELQEFLQVIDRDENGNPIIVGNPEFSNTHAMELAKNENGFEEIYDREQIKYDSTDLEAIILIKENINRILDKHREVSPDNDQNKRTLRIARSFIKFLDSKIISQQNSDVSLTVPTPENSLNWNGTQTEFIELVKALIENGNIKGTQTEIISKLSNVFNIKISYPNKLITDLKVRNNGSETLFLDKLKKSLFDYITIEK